MNKLRIKPVVAEDALKDVPSAARTGNPIWIAKDGNAASGKTFQVAAFASRSKPKFESSLMNA